MQGEVTKVNLSQGFQADSSREATKAKNSDPHKRQSCMYKVTLNVFYFMFLACFAQLVLTQYLQTFRAREKLAEISFARAAQNKPETKKTHSM